MAPAIGPATGLVAGLLFQWGVFMALTFRQKCGVVFLMGFALDIIQTTHILACTSRNAILSVTSLLLACFLGFWGHNWFVEYKSVLARWGLTVAGALGAGLGNLIVILWG